MRTVLIPLLAALLLSSVPAAEIPRKSGELVVQLPDRKQALVSDFRGKVLCLAVILTTCSHCQETTQIFNTVYPQLEPKGFRILEVAVNEDADTARFAKLFSTKFPVGWVAYPSAMQFLDMPANKPAYAPLIAFIDRKGMIRAQFTGADQAFFNAKLADNIRAEAEKLLKEPAGK